MKFKVPGMEEVACQVPLPMADGVLDLVYLTVSFIAVPISSSYEDNISALTVKDSFLTTVVSVVHS